MAKKTRMLLIKIIILIVVVIVFSFILSFIRHFLPSWGVGITIFSFVVGNVIGHFFAESILN